MSTIQDTVKALRATADQLEALIQDKPSPTLKSELLKHYAGAEPVLFAQFDAFTNCSKFDELMQPDEAGHCLMSTEAYELRRSEHAVRLQIRAGTTAKDAVSLVQKLLSYVRLRAKDEGDAAFSFPCEGPHGTGEIDGVPF